MATIETFELHPNLGSVWARVVDLWSGYIPNSATWTFGTGPGSTNVGGGVYRAELVTITTGADTLLYHLITLDCLSTKVLPLLYLTQQAQWFKMPGVQPPTLGGNDVLTFFELHLGGARQDLWASWTSAGADHHAVNDFALDVSGATTRVKMWTRFAGNEVVVDEISMTVTAGAFGLSFVNGAEPYSAAPGAAAPLVLAGGGGAPVDLTQVVNAIEDVANKEVDWTANQGGEIWSIYSRVKV